MGMFDKKRDEPSGFSSHGEQPGAHAGGVLSESPAHLQSIERAQAAREAAASTEPTFETTTPLVIAEPVANFDYEAETFTIRPGEVRQIAGRDALRKSIEVNNLSPARVQLAKTEKDARASWPPVRSMTLPPGGTVPRKFSHTAPIFVVVDPAAAADVQVDVIAERAKPPRP